MFFTILILIKIFTYKEFVSALFVTSKVHSASKVAGRLIGKLLGTLFPVHP